MIQSQRKAALPLFALLGFEAVAIVGLSLLGSSPGMQVPWHDLSSWLSTSSVDQLAAPIVRLTALAVAYWMLASTALCVLAYVSRNSTATRAVSMFTLPSVRRLVDGALAVSLATTTVMGVGGTAMAADASSTTISASADGNLSVPTPSITEPDNSASSTTSSSVVSTTTLTDDTSVGTPVLQDQATTTSEAPTTAAPTTAAPTTAAPETSTTLSVSPDGSTGSVPTPRLETSTTTSSEAPTTSTTVPPTSKAPAQPSTPTPETAPAPSTEVLGVQEHRVVPGDNLWNIARAQLASATNRDGSQLSEAEIRDYWLKVIDANKNNLRSHDPHWIFPGEIINLPAIDAASAS